MGSCTHWCREVRQNSNIFWKRLSHPFQKKEFFNLKIEWVTTDLKTAKGANLLGILCLGGGGTCPSSHYGYAYGKKALIHCV